MDAWCSRSDMIKLADSIEELNQTTQCPWNLQYPYATGCVDCNLVVLYVLAALLHYAPSTPPTGTPMHPSLLHSVTLCSPCTVPIPHSTLHSPCTPLTHSHPSLPLHSPDSLPSFTPPALSSLTPTLHSQSTAFTHALLVHMW